MKLEKHLLAIPTRRKSLEYLSDFTGCLAIIVLFINGNDLMFRFLQLALPHQLRQIHHEPLPLSYGMIMIPAALPEAVGCQVFENKSRRR